MKNYLVIFATIILLVPLVLAQNATVFQNGTIPASFSNTSYFGDFLKMYSNDSEFKKSADALILDWRSITGGKADSADLRDTSLIIIGTSLGAVDSAAMEAAMAQLPMFSNVTKIKDSETTADQLAKTPKLIILVGSPAQNAMTKEFQARGWLENKSYQSYGQLEIVYGKIPLGAPVIMVSSARSYENLQKDGVSASPLAAFIPEKYVPAAATGIAISLLALPSILGFLMDLMPGYLRTYLGKYLQFLGKGSKEIKEQFLGFTVFDFRFKVREFLSILLAASVFGAAMAYIFTGPKPRFIEIAFLNFFIAAFLYLARELIRLAINWWQKINTEFQFWLAGSIVTVVSAFLGNICNATYYILEAKDEKLAKKSGLIKMFVEFATTGVAIVFFALNVLMPDRLWQMFFVSASTLGAIESLPLKPLPGSGIKSWNAWAWLATFVIVWAIYLLLNFVL